MWETLGIPPSTERAVIRRAYAARLRLLDVDRNPAGFIALREAYERALAECETEEVRPPRPPPRPPARPPRPSAVAPVAPAPHGAGETDSAEHIPDDWLEQALARGGTVAAWDEYNRNMAQGLIGFRQQRSQAAKLVIAALADPALALPTFRAIAAILGPDGVARADQDALVRRDVAARLDAQAWLETVTRQAGLRALGRRRHEVRAARIFLGRRRRLGRSRPALEAVRHVLAAYRPHARWLTADVDAERIAAVEDRLDHALVRAGRREKWFIVAVVAFFVVDLIYVTAKALFFG